MRNKTKGTETGSVRLVRVLAVNLLLVVTLLALFGVGVLAVVQVGFFETDREGTARGMFAPLISLLVVVGMLLLKVAQMGRERVTELTLRNKQLELEREQSEQLVAADRRVRIARKMHDIVAHSLVVIIAMSDGAAAAIDEDLDLAKTALETTSETGRNALLETRRLVRVLRAPGEVPTDLPADPEPSQTSSLEEVRFMPTPDLEEVNGLINQFRAAGLSISYEISGGEVPADGPLQLTTYRIVQESLTNILRRAPSSTAAEVRLKVSCGGIEISVYNATSLAGINPRSDKGPIGTRERASVYDGHVTAGSAPGGRRMSITLHWEAQYENKTGTWVIPSRNRERRSVSGETEKIKVLLVDDQALIRMGLRMVLEACDDIEVVGEAADGKTALGMVCALQSNMVLMDVRMPNMNGIGATGEIVSESPGVKVLILTTFDLNEYAFEALRAGTSGFLLKDAKPEELVAAIRAVAAGDATISPRITKKMLDIFAPQLPDENVGADTVGAGATSVDAMALASLTERETEMLRLIVHGMTNQELADKLFISMTTVKTHVGNILNKVGVRDRVQAVIFAYESGLVN